MATPWPSSLPPRPLVAGYREGFEDRRIVSRTEVGPGKVRPRSLGSLRAFAMPFDVTATQRATLETHYSAEVRAGELPFTIGHPRTGAPIDMRFTRAPVYSPLTPSIWVAMVAAEAELAPMAGTGSLVWPASLPIQPLLSGYGEAAPDLALISDLPGGQPERRRRSIAVARAVRTHHVLSLAQVVTFESFYEGDTKGGALPFAWTHPFNGTVRAAFAGGPELDAIEADLFELSMAMEILP